MYQKFDIFHNEIFESVFLEETSQRVPPFSSKNVSFFKIFPDKGLERVDFAPITIFYGGNGSGKTTLLNILAELTGVTRHSAFSGSAFFKDYTRRCQLDAKPIPECSQILTSDDVTDYLLNIRYLNDGIDVRRNELFEEYLDRKYSS